MFSCHIGLPGVGPGRSNNACATRRSMLHLSATAATRIVRSPDPHHTTPVARRRHLVALGVLLLPPLAARAATQVVHRPPPVSSSRRGFRIVDRRVEARIPPGLAEPLASSPAWSTKGTSKGTTATATRPRCGRARRSPYAGSRSRSAAACCATTTPSRRRTPRTTRHPRMGRGRESRRVVRLPQPRPIVRARAITFASSATIDTWYFLLGLGYQLEAPATPGPRAEPERQTEPTTENGSPASLAARC